MIGVDAAEISYINQNLEHLPNFRSALASAINVELYSDARFLPGSIWPSFFTEKLPGEHGFYLIMAWDPSSMRLRRVTPERLPLEPFWRKLGGEGVRVISIDVPMSSRPQTGSSVEIVGWGTHQDLNTFSVYPAELFKEIKRRFGSSSLGKEIPVETQAEWSARAARDGIRHRLIESARRKAELITWLATTQEWEFLLAVLGEVHRGGHVLWKSDTHCDPHMLLDVYRAVDSSLGAIISCMRSKQARIGIFALHGIGSNNSQRHFVPEILRRFNQHWMGSAPQARQFSNLPHLTFLKTLRARMPRRITTRIANTLPLSLKDSLTNRLYAGGNDWSKTPALTLKSDGNGYIRFNLMGRESRGMLQQNTGESCRYLAELQRCFNSFLSEFNQPLVDEVRHISEIATGTRIHYLPDLIVTWAPQPQLVRSIQSPIFGQIVAKPDEWRGGYHRERGFLLLLDSPMSNREYPSRIHVTELASIMRDLMFH